MRRVIFGRSGLEVSEMGLGGGGPSKLGTSTGKTVEESRSIVRTALDNGVNVFDTSESYGTESIIGSALKDVKRDEIIICTKLHGGVEGRAKNLIEVEATLDKSLANLKTDYIDVYMMHAVGAKRYDAIAVPLYPSLNKMKEKGKIRAIGITECFHADRGHAMLQRALKDDWYDVIMVGFNILNPSARDRVLRKAQRQNVGVFDMFAVRRALRDFDALKTYLESKIKENSIGSNAYKLIDVLKECISSGDCETISEIAYRYCLREKGIHCVLSGTGSINHLKENLKIVEKGPLSQEVCKKIEAITYDWDHLSGQ